jgi:hypothetical protein
LTAASTSASILAASNSSGETVGRGVAVGVAVAVPVGVASAVPASVADGTGVGVEVSLVTVSALEGSCVPTKAPTPIAVVAMMTTAMSVNLFAIPASPSTRGR